jgi:hypothetical protein
MHKVSNVFTHEELNLMSKLIDERPDEDREIQSELGRLSYHNVIVPDSITDRLTQVVHSLFDTKLITRSSPLCVDYSSEYGIPDLPPHFDGDTNELIVDFQLSSNTRWDLGLGLDVYRLEDNSALIFNPNANIHWRPHKQFQDRERIRMLFFRFYNPSNIIDHSDVAYSRDHPIFDQVRVFRDSL